jgi:hypothetical protein
MSRKPKGAGAVMATHAPAVVEADDPQTALHRKLNYFPTPPWAARAGGELIQRLDPGPWTCWEPACGEGHMAHGLADYFPGGVASSDIHAHGFGAIVDFLSPAGDGWFGSEDPEWIVTNPPFDQAAAFVERALRRARRGVAMLCRLSWLETEGRFRLFFGERPLAVYAPFFDRLSLMLGRWEPGHGGNATAYAWFVWFTPAAEPAWLSDLRSKSAASCVALAIPPRSKARLTRPTDARLFGKAGDAPLFGGVS